MPVEQTVTRCRCDDLHRTVAARLLVEEREKGWCRMRGSDRSFPNHRWRPASIAVDGEKCWWLATGVQAGVVRLQLYQPPAAAV